MKRLKKKKVLFLLAGKRTWAFMYSPPIDVFKAHRWLYHSTLGSRVMKKREETSHPHSGLQMDFVKSPCVIFERALR